VPTIAVDQVVTMFPRMSTIEVPITVSDPIIPGTNRTYLVEAKAIKGGMVGDPIGALIVSS
jgi:hypothetical protein